MKKGLNARAGLMLGLALLLAACGSSPAAPTVAATAGLAESTAAVTLGPAATAAASSTPAAHSLATATLGGPVVVTALPAGTAGSGTPGATQPPVPVPTPIPTLAGGLSPAVIKYHVLAAFPNFFYCDPDLYPVARDQTQAALRSFPSLQANAAEYQAILAHNNLAGAASLTTAQKVLVYQDHKRLAAVRFELQNGQYQFQLMVKDARGQGELVTGLVDGQGAITAQQGQPALATCPV